jgi:phenylacetate-CoA ligase
MGQPFPVEAVQNQLRRCSELPYYRRLFDEHGVTPGAVTTAEEFRELPLLDRETLEEVVGPPVRESGLYHEDTALLGFTPGRKRDLMAEFDTHSDFESSARAWARLYESAGLGAGDIVYNAYGHEWFSAAQKFQRAAQMTGATVIPAGPGETQQAVSTIEANNVNAYLGNPTFALKLADNGVTTLDTLILGGEPFTSVPGYRAELKAAFDGDVTAVDTYGLSELLPVAGECANENGLHIATDYVYAEVIDPETETVLPPGERGELVVTHLSKESMPLLRYRTGDLTMLDTVDCCGESVPTLPRSVFGRVDSMLKVKGVKFYPDELGGILSAVDGLTGEYQVCVTRPRDIDHIELRCEGTADREEIRNAIQQHTFVSLDEITVTETLDATQTVVDKRYT